MKHNPNPSLYSPGVPSCLAKTILRHGFACFSLAAALWLVSNHAVAGNLLVNPSFETNGYAGSIPFGWGYFQPPFAGNQKDYYEEESSGATCDIPVPSTNGTYFWKQWNSSYNASTNAVAGVYQVFGSAPGSVYQADGWLASGQCDVLGADCFTWIQVSFLNASSNVLAVYKSSDFNSSQYQLNDFVDLAITNACDVTQRISTAGAGGQADPYFTNFFAVTGAVSQIVAPAGTTMVRFDFCYLAVEKEGGSAYFDAANLNLISGPQPPVISSIYPANMIFVPPGSNLSFTVSSPTGVTVPANNIHLSLNGTDVSSSLTITGSASSKNALYTLLQSNQTYNVSITVTDAAGLSASASTFFQTTWVGIPPVAYLWEAEDWDFTNGMFINSPDLCNAPGDPNCYFGKTGVEYFDENSSYAIGDHDYRTNDLICTKTSGDYFRPNLYAAGRPDYAINPFVVNEWVNYTRNFSNGFYNIYCRAAGNNGDSACNATLFLVTDDATNELGTFNFAGLGYTTFTNVLLIGTNHNPAIVPLNGKATLRLVEGGDFLPTFLALVSVAGDTPVLTGLYPTGSRPFEYTNALSFNLTTAGGASFPANGIQVNLDGFNVSSNLVITGSSSNKTVVYPFLQPNATHSVTITATNSFGHGTSVQVQFDTFNETNNYMWECEDYDYGGGQYITNWFPDAYADYNGPYNAETNIDFDHFSLSGEEFYYRAIGIPQDILNRQVYQDYVRQEFVNAGAQDFILVYFSGPQYNTNGVLIYNGDWANYTRNYPTGDYYVYARASGNAGTTNIMYLDQVVHGVGTTNQTLRLVGYFPDPGQGYDNYQWVPFTDAGFSAPVPVRFGGVETLRLTTEGNANCNYFMLVPATGIRLTAARLGQSTVLSFPTKSGANYRVFYRNSLTAGNWTLLTTVLGNGSPQQVNDPATASARFYQVVSP